MRHIRGRVDMLKLTSQAYMFCSLIQVTQYPTADPQWDNSGQVNRIAGGGSVKNSAGLSGLVKKTWLYCRFTQYADLLVSVFLRGS